MVTFLPRWRLRILVVLAVELVSVAWWRGRRAPAPRPTPEVQPAANIVRAARARCLEPRPRAGVYAVGAMRVAVVDGCVAAEVEDGELAVPHLHPNDGEPTRRAEVVLVPSMMHYARGDDGLILAVAPDHTITAFHRLRAQRTRPAATLTLIMPLDDRDPPSLLVHDDPIVQAAALSWVMRKPLDRMGCNAVRRWSVDAITDARRHDVVQVLFFGLAYGHAIDRCLVPEIRQAIAQPSLVVAAALALAQLGTPAEKAEALVTILEAPHHDGTDQAAHLLARYLHPEHCGVDAARCLSADEAAALTQRLGPGWSAL